MSLETTARPHTLTAAPGLALEHFFRYQLAARLAYGRVLDIGCGSGYGTAMLAPRADRLWGVDCSRSTVAYAARRFATANSRYLAADAGALPFPGGGFDVVVCFGLLDDLAGIGRILDEARRVLSASGALLVSVADGGWTPKLEGEGLAAMLAERFTHVRLFGRRADTGSGHQAASWAPADALVSGRPADRPASEAALHRVAVCSHRNLEKLLVAGPPTEPGDLEDLGEELLRDHARRETETRAIYEKVVEDLRARLEGFDSRIRRLGHEVEQARGPQTAELRRQLGELGTRVGRLEQERNDLWHRLHVIHGSRMWRAWMVYHGWLRGVRRLVRGVLEALGLARTGVRLAGRWALQALLLPPHALGWLYLWTTTRRMRRRAKARRPGLDRQPLEREVVHRGPMARQPRVLLVSPFPLYPTDHGGAVRIVNLIRRIAPHVELQVLVFSQAADNEAQRRALAPYCTAVHFHRWRPAWRPDLWGLSARGAQLFRSAAVAERLRELVAREAIDVVQLEYTELGQYVDAVPAARTILTEIDITFRSRYRRRAAGFHRRYAGDWEFGFSRGDLMRLMRFEVEVASRADQVHVMSVEDGVYLGSFLGDGAARLRVVPNAVDTETLYPPAPDTLREGALFIGNFQHMPNLDAFDYLMAEVWPRVRRRLPSATLSVVGAHTPDSVRAFHGRDGVDVVGPVPEVLPHYRRHRVLVAPIRAGSGTRLKILEAMACGLPVVSTPMGAEGLEGANGEHLLLAETADGLAEAVARVLEDGELSRRLSIAGRTLAVDRYDWSLSAGRLLEAYRELMPEADRLPAPAERDADLARSKRRQRRKRSAATPEVSVVIPTLDGGELLGEVLEAVFAQATERRVEVVLVDSASTPEHRAIMERHPVRIETIDRADFDHGLTRDLGAERARGEVLVFLNQDALPGDERWLETLVEPLFAGDRRLAAVQGGIRERPDPEERFYWDSCGHRFYFTSESDRWIARFGGIGFSTVNAAISRRVWRAHPFGRAAIMEDKKWQREVTAEGYRIVTRTEAFVLHTHDYDFDALVRRCVSEGYGWSQLGEPYRLRDLARDLARPRIYADLARGLAGGRVRSAAELLFPWVRPLMLYRGSRFSRGVQ